MLLSLIKIILFICLVSVIAFFANSLIEYGDQFFGELKIIFVGTEYIISPNQIIFLIGFLLVLVWIALKLFSLLLSIFRFCNGEETAMSFFFQRRRQKKGIKALSQGMIAIASGDGDLALANSIKVKKYLNQSTVVNLLTAQAAELLEDKARATEIYKSLLLDQDASFVGIQGLLKQKLKDGDIEIALKLAEKAFSLQPKNQKTLDVLFQLQTQTKNWDAARATLRAKYKSGALTKDVHKRRDAILALSHAKKLVVSGNIKLAHEHSIEACKLSPDLVPAAILATKSYIEAGKSKQASNIVKKAWQNKPHPDLAKVFFDIFPEEKPGQRLKRFEILKNTSPNHRETKLILADLYFEIGEFSKAKKELENLIKTSSDKKILSLMAKISRGAGETDEIVNTWLTKALEAKDDPYWICENCLKVHDDWVAVCIVCGAFDTLDWTAHPSSIGQTNQLSIKSQNNLNNLETTRLK